MAMLSPSYGTGPPSPSSRRAWIEIRKVSSVISHGRRSPSSRRAWIEIRQDVPGFAEGQVALLAEGVDRNLEDEAAKAAQEASPSSRRAWIEIF